MVRETKLPGVGVRHEFTTEDGNDIAVIVHHDGRREILAYETEDPDACHSLVSLDATDTQTLAEILGVSQVTETVAEVRQDFDGHAIEWVDLPDGSKWIGASLATTRVEERSGATVVAVIRDHDSFPAPAADFELHAHDVVVAVGGHDDLCALRALLEA